MGKAGILTRVLTQTNVNSVHPRLTAVIRWKYLRRQLDHSKIYQLKYKPWTLHDRAFTSSEAVDTSRFNDSAGDGILSKSAYTFTVA